VQAASGTYSPQNIFLCGTAPTCVLQLLLPVRGSLPFLNTTAGSQPLLVNLTMQEYCLVEMTLLFGPSISLHKMHLGTEQRCQSALAAVRQYSRLV